MITDENDSDIGPDTCEQVLVDLTPTGRRMSKTGRTRIAPYTVYIAESVIKNHEQLHLYEVEQMVLIPLFKATKIKSAELETTYASECGSPRASIVVA